MRDELVGVLIRVPPTTRAMLKLIAIERNSSVQRVVEDQLRKLIAERTGAMRNG